MVKSTLAAGIHMQFCLFHPVCYFCLHLCPPSPAEVLYVIVTQSIFCLMSFNEVVKHLMFCLAVELRL